MRKGRWCALALWLAVPLAAFAETVYVVDRLQVGLRATRDGAVVKTVESGAAFEVLERDERFARVRDKQGTEGWLELRYLSAEPPARLQLAKLQDDLNKARAQIAETQAQPKNAGNAAANAPPTPAATPTESDAGYELDYLWLGIAFAMLIAGFIAGIVWHRESIRRRMGGMYLRI